MNYRIVTTQASKYRVQKLYHYVESEESEWGFVTNKSHDTYMQAQEELSSLLRVRLNSEVAAVVGELT